MPKTTTLVLHNIVKTTLRSLNGKALLYLNNISNDSLYNSHLPFYLGDGRFHFKKRHFIYYTSLIWSYCQKRIIPFQEGTAPDCWISPTYIAIIE